MGVEFLGIEETTTRGNKMEKIESFPKLQHLTFDSLLFWEEWRGWSGLENDDFPIIMPSLVSLSIKECDSLKAPLPAFLQKTPLENLTISGRCRYLKQHDKEGMKTDDRIQILTSECNITEMTEATNSRDQRFLAR